MRAQLPTTGASHTQTYDDVGTSRIDGLFIYEQGSVEVPYAIRLLDNNLQGVEAGQGGYATTYPIVYTYVYFDACTNLLKHSSPSNC